MKSAALVIGVNDYSDPDIARLDASHEDASTMKGILKDGVEFDWVEYLPDPDQKRVLDKLTQLKNRLSDGDLLILYFAGHGIIEKGEQLLLLPDARYNRIRHRSETLGLQLLCDETSGLGLSRLFILDCCRNHLEYSQTRNLDAPPEFSTEGVRDLIRRKSEPTTPSADEPFAVLCSCSEGERSHEREEHGLFTRAMADVLRTMKKQNERVILSTKSDFLSRVTAELDKLRAHYNISDSQVPSLVSNVSESEYLLWEPGETPEAQRLKLMQEAWEHAEAEDKISTYETFKLHYPDSLFIDKADAAIERLQRTDEFEFWAEVKSKNREASYQEYLLNYPKGVYAESALEQLKKLSMPAAVEVESEQVQSKSPEQPLRDTSDQRSSSRWPLYLAVSAIAAGGYLYSQQSATFTEAGSSKAETNPIAGKVLTPQQPKKAREEQDNPPQVLPNLPVDKKERVISGSRPEATEKISIGQSLSESTDNVKEIEVKFKAHLKADRLTSPHGNNALVSIKELEDISSSDSERLAKQARELVTQRYVELSKLSVSNGDMSKALSYLEKGETVLSAYSPLIEYHEYLLEKLHKDKFTSLATRVLDGKEISNIDLRAIKKEVEILDPYALAVYSLLLSKEKSGVSADFDLAVKYAKESAMSNNYIGQFSLALLYQKGRGLEKDDVQAVTWIKKAAEQGYAEAQNQLGGEYLQGRGIKKDDEQAVVWFKKAAEQGHTLSQFNLARVYSKGIGTKKDDEQAVVWFKKAATQGHVLSQTTLGWFYYEGTGTEQNFQKALKWTNKAANQNDAQAQINLGLMYTNGNGIEKNYQEALNWFRKAAHQGFPWGQHNLGIMYREGRGVKRDYEKAYDWILKSADQGLPEAQNNLGIMYREGRGVKKNYQKALDWFRKSADQGLRDAQNNLGFMYERGYGVTKDYQQAFYWFRKSADQGLPEALNNLGYMYENGYGVIKDYQQALYWFRKSMDQGYQPAVKHWLTLKTKIGDN